MRQKKFETYLGRGVPHLFENHEFLIFSACGHVQVDQEPTRKLFSLLSLWFLVNFYLYFQKIVDFVTFLVCSQCIELWKWDFHPFSVFVVSGRFSWPLKGGSEHSKNLFFDFPEYYSRWTIGKPGYQTFYANLFWILGSQKCNFGLKSEKKPDFCHLCRAPTTPIFPPIF